MSVEKVASTLKPALAFLLCVQHSMRVIARGLCFCGLSGGGPRTNQHNLPGQVIIDKPREDPEDFHDHLNSESTNLKAETFVAKGISETLNYFY